MQFLKTTLKSNLLSTTNSFLKSKHDLTIFLWKQDTSLSHPAARSESLTSAKNTIFPEKWRTFLGRLNTLNPYRLRAREGALCPSLWSGYYSSRKWPYSMAFRSHLTTSKTIHFILWKATCLHLVWLTSTFESFFLLQEPLESLENQRLNQKCRNFPDFNLSLSRSCPTSNQKKIPKDSTLEI